MAVQHTNRKGDTYHLLVGKTKTGKPKYYFSKKAGGTPVDAIPDGFEIFENPENAQVLLRKGRPRLVTDQEKEMVEAAIRDHAKASHFIVDVDGDSLVVYLPDTDACEAATDFARFGFIGIRERQQDAIQMLVNRSRFTRMMRFVLADREKRLFNVERWCFRGSIDNWFPLDGEQLLEKLLKKYAKHLGRESFFELM